MPDRLQTLMLVAHHYTLKGASIMVTSLPGTSLGQGGSFSKGWAILLIILGFFALALPFEAGIAIAVVVAVLVIIAGIAHLAGTFAARTTGGFFWRLLVGCAYLVAGVYLLVHPKASLVSLTLALAVLFFVEGIFHIVTYFQIRSAPGAGWLLFDGIVTLILAKLAGQRGVGSGHNCWYQPVHERLCPPHALPGLALEPAIDSHLAEWI
jgi:uncharacterized membrane protein HdeD (DUF308 family)